MIGEKINDNQNELKKNIKIESGNSEIEKNIQDTLNFQKEEIHNESLDKKENIKSNDEKENNSSHITLDPPKELTLISLNVNNLNDDIKKDSPLKDDNVNNNSNDSNISMKDCNNEQENKNEVLQKNQLNELNKDIIIHNKNEVFEKEENLNNNNEKSSKINVENSKNEFDNIMDTNMNSNNNLIINKPIKYIEENKLDLNNNNQIINNNQYINQNNEQKITSTIKMTKLSIIKDKSSKEFKKEEMTKTITGITIINPTDNNNITKETKESKSKSKIISNTNKENSKFKNKINKKVITKEKRGISSDTTYNIHSKLNEKNTLNKINNIKYKNALKEVASNIPKIQRAKSVKAKNIQINYKNNININIGGKVPSHYSTYVPRLYNDKIMKKWEEVHKKNWYKLSPRSRAIANEEMEKIKISMDEEIRNKKELID
jgi:hypothetical protein